MNGAKLILPQLLHDIRDSKEPSLSYWRLWSRDDDQPAHIRHVLSTYASEDFREMPEMDLLQETMDLFRVLNQHMAAQEDASERFQKFRAVAQGNLVKLAGFALASDFTPRRIAVQLSNDLYR